MSADKPVIAPGVPAEAPGPSPLPTEKPSLPRSAEAGAAVFVWVIWALVLLGLTRMALSYNITVPWADEWSHTAILSGDQPVSLAWLWEQHNEHRFPLGKLFWVESLRLTHFSFQFQIFPNLLLLAGLTAALIVQIRAVRGWTSYTDAFLPLLVLNPGQYENIFWGFQTSFFVAETLACILLLIMARSALSGAAPTRRVSVLTGACLVLLPLFTAAGLVFGVALSLWALYAAYQYRQHIFARKLLLVSGGISLMLAAVYFIGWHRPPQVKPFPGLRAAAVTVLEFLSGALGQEVARMLGLGFGLAILLLLLSSMLMLVLVWIRKPHLRASALGLFMFLGVGLALALAVGWGRSGFGAGSGLASRYVTNMVPALCCVYFVWQMYARPVASRLLQFSLFTAMCIALPINMNEARSFRSDRVHNMAGFDAELRHGVSPEDLTKEYGAFLGDPDYLGHYGAQWMRMLHRAGVGPFRYMSDSHPLPPRTAAAEAPSSTLEGHLDIVDSVQIAGWAWDSSRPDLPVSVDIRDGDNLLSTIRAHLFRDDLLAAHKGNGLHGFSCPAPRDGKRHVIRVFISGTDLELHGSPKEIGAGQ